MPVTLLLLFFIGFLQRSGSARASFECQQLRYKVTAVPAELYTKCTHDDDDDDGLSTVNSQTYECMFEGNFALNVAAMENAEVLSEMICLHTYLNEKTLYWIYIYFYIKLCHFQLFQLEVAINLLSIQSLLLLIYVQGSYYNPSCCD